MFTSKEKADEAKREVHLRKWVYSGKVENGTMGKSEAERRIAIMQEISDDYSRLAEAEEPQGKLL